jgi:TnpA family transposase
MLRHMLHDLVREETLTAANAEIVNRHHELPLSAVHGTGTLSSSDAQRFGIRASSLLASYYPRYYGYYEKAIGIYTHISDQYAVFSTKVISCSPREALYVLDGLLENNTILKIREHTTDTHGFTENIHIPSLLVVTPCAFHDGLEIATRYPHGVSSASET